MTAVSTSTKQDASGISGATLLMVLTLLVGIASTLVPNQAQALADCTRVASTCTSSGNRSIEPSNNGNAPPINVNKSCWNTQEEWQCATGETTSTCDADDIQGCMMGEEEVIETSAGGTPIAWDQTWVCPDDATSTCQPPGVTLESLENDAYCNEYESVCNESVGDYCIDEDVYYSCQQPTEPCVDEGDDETCVLVNTECVSDAGEGNDKGCLTEEKTYECSTETEICTEVGVVNTCDIEMMNGLNEHNKDDQSGKLAELAKQMQILKAIENDIEGMPPRVFGGDELHCTRDVFGQIGLGENCCSRSVTQGDGSMLDQCTADEERLGTARRAGRSKFVADGDFVRQYIDLLVGGFCSFTEKKREWYCAFDSLLARIIQEQGREQLKQLAQSAVPGGNTTLDFPYLSGNGRWNSASVAGYTFKAYSYPEACETEGSDSNADCPDGLNFKLLVSGNGVDIDRRIDSTEQRPQAIGRSILVSPNAFDSMCDLDSESSTFGKCSLKIKAWSETNGQASVPVTISSSRFGHSDGWSPTSPGGDDWEFAMRQVAFEGSSIPDDEPVTIRWRKDGGIWQHRQLPSPLAADAGVKINGEAPVYGQCVEGECTYTIRIPVDALVKPWVDRYWTQQHGCEDRYELDCSGFTLAEFQMLDISKMDLSEFEASIQSKIRADVPDADDYKSTVEAGVERGAELADQGTKAPITQEDPQATQYSAWLDDSQVIEGNAIHAYANAEWPEKGSGNYIASASVDWGDGHTSSMSSTGTHFKASHTYSNTGEYVIYVTQVMPDGTEHKKRLRAVVESGDDPMRSSLGGTPF